MVNRINGQIYATGVWLSSPSVNAVNPSINNAQSRLNEIVNRALSLSPSSSSAVPSASPPPVPTRWSLRIRTYALVLSAASASASAAPTRIMYTIQDGTRLDDSTRPVTVLIEDTASKAVNISTIQARHLDTFFAAALLPPAGAGGGAGAGTGDSKEAAAARLGRWVPRSVHVLAEGVSINDTARDFKLQVAMLTTRGRDAGASANRATDKLLVQLGYTPVPFFANLVTRQQVLEPYLDAVLPKASTRKDLSLDITSIDWQSLLAVLPSEESLPVWGSRNTAWCVVKLLKAEGLV